MLQKNVTACVDVSVSLCECLCVCLTPICPVHTQGPLGWYDVFACLCVFACIHLSSQYASLFISPFRWCICVHKNIWVHEYVFLKSMYSHLSALYVSQSVQIRSGNLTMFSFLHVFLLQFPEAGMFETVWQVKYYNYNKRDHCQWGNSFNSIEYECKPNDTRTLMWVNKEMFVWRRGPDWQIQCVYFAKTQAVMFVTLSMSWCC